MPREAPALAPRQRLTSERHEVVAAYRRLGPLPLSKEPVLAEEHEPPGDDARPVGHSLNVESREVADRLQRLLADRDQERHEADRVDAAVDDGNDLGSVARQP